MNSIVSFCLYLAKVWSPGKNILHWYWGMAIVLWEIEEDYQSNSSFQLLLNYEGVIRQVIAELGVILIPYVMDLIFKVILS